MAVTANSIITPQAPKSNVIPLVTANTPVASAPVTSVLLLTAGANGARLTRLQATPAETQTANHVQMYRAATMGGTKYLANGVVLPSTTVSVTSAATPADFGYSDDNPLILSGGETIYMANGLTKNVNVVAEWADY